MDLEDKLRYLNYAKIILPILGVIIIVCIEIWIFNIENRLEKIKENKTDDTRQKDKEEIIDSIKSLQKDPTEKVKTGFAFAGILIIHNRTDTQRKYILDIGDSETNNRTSLYCDANNSLVYRIIDNEGEIFSIKTPENFLVFKRETPYFIYCDCGISENFSFIRMFIDDKQVGYAEFKTLINLPKGHQFDKMTLGADLTKKFGGSFSITSLYLYEAPLNSKDLEQLRTHAIYKYQQILKNKEVN